MYALNYFKESLTILKTTLYIFICIEFLKGLKNARWVV